MNKNRKVWLGIFLGAFILIQLLFIGMVIGIISLASNGFVLSTGTYGGDLALTIICALFIPNIVLGVIASYWYVNKNSSQSSENKNDELKPNDGDVEEEPKDQLPSEKVVVIDEFRAYTEDYGPLNSIINHREPSQVECPQENIPQTQNVTDEEKKVSNSEEKTRKNYVEPIKFFFSDVKKEIKDIKRERKYKKFENSRLDILPEQIVEPRKLNSKQPISEEVEIVNVDPIKVPLGKKIKGMFKKEEQPTLKNDSHVETVVIEEPTKEEIEPSIDLTDVTKPTEVIHKDDQPNFKPIEEQEKPRTIKFETIDEDNENQLENYKKEIEASKAKEIELIKQKFEDEKEQLKHELELKQKHDEELEKQRKEFEEEKQKLEQELKLQKEKEQQALEEQKRLEAENIRIQKEAAKEAKRLEKEKVKELKRKEKEESKQNKQEIKKLQKEQNAKISELEEMIKEKKASIMQMQEEAENNSIEDTNISSEEVESDVEKAPKTWLSQTNNNEPEQVVDVPIQHIASKTWLSQNRVDQINVYAPFDGVVIPLSQVPDQMFNEGYAGDGLAIIPESYDVNAIVTNGTIGYISENKNIYSFTVADININMYLGLQTNELNQKAFKTKTQLGESVDLTSNIVTIKPKIFATAYSPISPIVVKELNGREIECVVYENQQVKQGDLLYIIK